MIERVEIGEEQATATWDVAVVGAGYVGVPLAQVFAEAGRSVLIVDVVGEVIALPFRAVGGLIRGIF